MSKEQPDKDAIEASRSIPLLDCAIPKGQRFTVHDVLRAMYPDGNVSHNEKVRVSMRLIEKARRGRLRLVGRMNNCHANIYEAI